MNAAIESDVTAQTVRNRDSLQTDRSLYRVGEPLASARGSERMMWLGGYVKTLG